MVANYFYKIAINVKPVLNKIMPNSFIKILEKICRGLLRVVKNIEHSIPLGYSYKWAKINTKTHIGSKVPRPSSKTGKKTVAFLTNQLLDWNDLRPRYGGGERVCVTLAFLLKDLGFEITFFQTAGKEFEGNYYDFPVIGIPLGELYSEFNYSACNAFYDISMAYDHVIYNLPEYSSGKMREDALMICHGIWFDHDNYGPSITFRTPKWFSHLYRAFSNPQSIVSVDTNSINVIRALWPKLAEKMQYIPNFVDTKVFYPPLNKKRDIITVIFPRRSQINRGSRILELILKEIPYSKCRFLWVGEGDGPDTDLIKNLAKKDQRLEYYSEPFEKMPDLYKDADICVIPTIACEGTSLSCLEGLASGCATIATYIGGLSNIIMSGWNGLLVEPTPHSIAKAINYLIENEEKRLYFQEKGRESSLFFDMELWKMRWMHLLQHNGWIEKDFAGDKGIPIWF